MRKIRLPKFKKETIYLFVAGIACVLLLVGTMLLLNSHLKSSAAMDVSKIDSSRSHIMVTGKGYYAKRGKKSEEEKKRKSRTRSDKSKAWKKAAPNPRNTKRSESRTGKIIKGDAGGKKGRGGRSPGKISPQDPSATPDDSAKTPADDANSGTNKRKNKKNKKQNDGKGNKTKVEESNPKAPILTVKFENVDRIENNTTYIKGTSLRFSLSATTHKGKKIERSEDWYVWLNGDKMYSRGGSKYKGLYTANTDSPGIPKLKSTVNNIVITVKDGDNKTTETYRISMDTSKPPKKIGTVTVSCDLDEIGIGIGEYTKDGKDGKPVKDEDKGEKVTPDNLNIFVPTTMRIYEGDTVSDVVEEYFDSLGIDAPMDITPRPGDPKKNQVYLKKISGNIIKKADKKVANEPQKNYRKYRSERKGYNATSGEEYLSEKDYGSGSGWKFKYNGGIPERAMSDVEVNNGDKIILLYVLHP